MRKRSKTSLVISVVLVLIIMLVLGVMQIGFSGLTRIHVLQIRANMSLHPAIGFILILFVLCLCMKFGDDNKPNHEEKEDIPPFWEESESTINELAD